MGDALMKTMRPLTEKIVAEHMPTRTSACTCGGMQLGEYYPRHIANVTEAAVREEVARDIETARSEAAARIAESHLPAWQEALANAARIARGGVA